MPSIRLLSAVGVTGAVVSSVASAQLPANLPRSLTAFPVPEPSNLDRFVRDREAAVRLGKALFWDQSLGSDGKIACASCHFAAGADARSKNQRSPGLLAGDSGFFAGKGPNWSQTLADHPHTAFLDPADRFSERIRNDNDVVSSAGTFFLEFLGIDPHKTKDLSAPLVDDTFRVGPRVTRRVEPRNSPTVIGAAFNISQFWDGRARFLFNGVNPFGSLDRDAHVHRSRVVGGVRTVDPIKIKIAFSSLASQAVGPPLSEFEMSALGRTWADVGRKMLSLRPLRQQLVHPDDSVLGTVSRWPAQGIDERYVQLVRAAFNPRWWRAPEWVIEFAPDGSSSVAPAPSEPLAENQYTLMEANFSLFFGLAIQMYESTLIPDDSKFDRILRGEASPTAEELLGMRIFFNMGEDPLVPQGKCVECHSGPLLSGVTFPELLVGGEGGVLEGLVERMDTAVHRAAGSLFLTTAVADLRPGLGLLEFDPRGKDFALEHADSDLAFGLRFPGTEGACDERFRFSLAPIDPPTVFEIDVEFESTADCVMTFDLRTRNLPPGVWRVVSGGVEVAAIEALPPVLYDHGFYNIGVRPTEEDFLRGGTALGRPLSWTRLAQSGFDVTRGFPGVEDLLPTPPPSADEGTAVDGAAKTPILLNVELTAPYMHNGGMGTLREVVEFYNRGGNFHEHNILNLDNEIEELGLNDEEIDALVAFMKTLTDERVRNRQAPFDNPELFVFHGHKGNHVRTFGRDGQSGDEIFRLDPVGAAGGTPIPLYPNLGSD